MELHFRLVVEGQSAMGKGMGQSVEGLTLNERIKRYRQFADDAAKKALSASNPELRAGFLSMATGWSHMANHLERQLPDEPPGAFPLSHSGPGEERH